MHTASLQHALLAAWSLNRKKQSYKSRPARRLHSHRQNSRQQTLTGRSELHLGGSRPALPCDDHCKAVLSNSCCALDKLPVKMQLLMVEQVRSILVA